ncbi:transmembrane protein 70, mitochondrial-like [Actinia tenebrosa]|uniref:Transmembrane protein 70, mitochondrial-like n=1 Tax=Actinia tenebrosa TaxID=6105 RepID=A0A6P8J3Z8_ACTTE|nr:transmembrane protein 70, mitochondrial-like [Actinia tenebrosa]
MISCARLASIGSGMSRYSSLLRPASTISRVMSSHVQGRKTIITKIQSSNMSQGINDPNNHNWNLVYEGPLSKSVKYVKGFSLTTAAASIAGSPILVYFGKQSVPIVGKLAIAGLLCIIGNSTTVLLHWFSKAYVHKMYYDSTRQVFSAETSSFLGRLQRTDFEVKDIIFPQEESAFSTFEAKGKKFFLHQEMVEAQQVLHFLREAQM